MVSGDMPPELARKGIKLFDDSSKEFLEDQFLRQSASVRDISGVVEFLTRRSVLPESDYHLFIPNELSLANLKRDDLEIIGLWLEVINQGIFMAKKGVITADIPLADASELLGWLNATRAIDMKHERLMAENTVNLRKIEEPKTSGSILDRFRKKSGD